MKKISPISSMFQSIKYLLTGRIHFLHTSVGKKMVLDNEEWVVFRQIVVDPDKNRPEIPQAVFRPRFHVKGMKVKQNILFSNFSIPFFIGLPGFRSKTWMYNEETGDFSGYYEWDTVEDAENYKNSFAASFMTNRSEPESVSFTVEKRVAANPFF